MSKSNKTQKKISFELNIKSLFINLEEETSATIYWVRGIFDLFNEHLKEGKRLIPEQDLLQTKKQFSMKDLRWKLF